MQHKMSAKFGLSLSTRAVLFDWGTMDDLVDAAVTALTSLIEPLVIAVLGVVIGTIVIALFLPVFEVSTHLGY